jgi:hypothetical protein
MGQHFGDFVHGHAAIQRRFGVDRDLVETPTRGKDAETQYAFGFAVERSAAPGAGPREFGDQMAPPNLCEFETCCTPTEYITASTTDTPALVEIR